MEHNDTNLFGEFPPVSPSDWKKKIIDDLKGADYEKKLIYRPIEGFGVQPFYTEEDLRALDYLTQFPAEFPFVRGNEKSGNNWFIRQDIQVGDLKRTNEKALDILMKGIDSLGFTLDENKDYTQDDLDLLLKNIFAEILEINFHCGKNALSLLRNHYAMLERYNRDFKKIYGSLDYDPFGRLITRGNYYASKAEDLETCSQLIRSSEHLPHFNVICIHGDHFHDSGATIIEELAFSLACGAEYLTQLTEKGFSVNQVAPKIRFRFPVGSNYFMEIAKFRAARLLWAQVVKAYGPSKDDVARMTIHAVTSRWNKAMYDPYVNMLRTTTEAMSAIIAGIDSLTVSPFDEVYTRPGDFSERIARNQQLLLKEESYLDQVADPSAGSYYIENLTDSIVAETWKLFLEVDSLGGFLEAVSNGFIQARIGGTAKKRKENVGNRKDTILGVNQYPNFNEAKDPGIKEDALKALDGAVPGAIVEVLKPFRAAQPFEALRYKMDLYARDHKRPAAFMLTYGNLAMRIARSQFARNFFACAGFETIDNLGFKSAEEGVDAFFNSKAEILVICSADEEYARLAPEVKELVGDKGIVVVAGYPKDIVEELRAKGIEHFVHVKSNVLEELRRFQEMVGL